MPKTRVYVERRPVVRRFFGQFTCETVCKWQSGVGGIKRNGLALCVYPLGAALTPYVQGPMCGVVACSFEIGIFGVGVRLR